MKLLSAVLVFMAIPVMIFSQVWERTVENIGNDRGNSITATSDGGFIVAGAVTPSDTSSATKAFFFKLDSTGTFMWYKKQGVAGYNSAYHTVIEKDKKYYLGGSSSFSMRLSVFSEFGMEELDTIYNNNQLSTIYDIQVNSNNQIMLAGSGKKNLISVDSEGNWLNSYEHAVNINDIMITSDDNYFLVGEINSKSTSGVWEFVPALFAAKISKAGELLWKADFDEEDFGSFSSIAETSDGSIIAVGYNIDTIGTFFPNITSSRITKFSKEGNILWEKKGENNSQFNSIVSNNKQNFFIGGQIIDPIDNYYDSVIMKINEDGNTLLETVFGTEEYSAVTDLAIKDNGILAVLQERKVSDLHQLDITVFTMKTDDTSVETDDILNLGNKSICYPNPFTSSTKIAFDHINANNTNLECTVEIYNIEGVLSSKTSHIINTDSKKQSFEINLQDLPNGIYNYIVKTKVSSYFGKMIKK